MTGLGLGQGLGLKDIQRASIYSLHLHFFVHFEILNRMMERCGAKTS